jgi:hypothetical protein
MALRRIMICAACLTQGRPLVDDAPDDPRHRTAAGAAITVVYGEAVCLDHWHDLSAPLDG